MSYYVVVHGGAGSHSTQSEKDVRKSMRRACTKALQLLQSGGKAYEAVEESISELEDSECLNAGYGSNLTVNGTVECDAAIMDGSGNFGSVGAVSGVKNPIRVAKAILDHSRIRDPLGRIAPLTLVSTGARDFAAASNIATVDSNVMISPRAWNEWGVWKEKVATDMTNALNHPTLTDKDHILQDTVGSVVLCSSGDIAAGVSSGGLLLKPSGRVGEAAIFGAGCWALRSDTVTTVACSVSGTGEAIIRASLARTLSDALCRSPEDSHEELRRVLAEDFAKLCAVLGEEQGPSAGVVALTRDPGTAIPRLWCAFNTATMAVAYASSDDPKPKSMILRRNEAESRGSDDVKSIYLTALAWTDH